MLSTRIGLIATISATVLTASAAFPAHGQAFWTNPQPGIFADPANWSSGVIPGADGIGVFGVVPGSTPFDVTLDAATAIGRLRITNQMPVFRLHGHELTVLRAIDLQGNSETVLTFVDGTVSCDLLSLNSGFQRGDLVLDAIDFTANHIWSSTVFGASNFIRLRNASTVILQGTLVSSRPDGDFEIHLETGSRWRHISDDVLVSIASGPQRFTINISGASEFSTPPNATFRVGNSTSIRLQDQGSLFLAMRTLEIGAPGSLGNSELLIENGSALQCGNFLSRFIPIPSFPGVNIILSGEGSQLQWSESFVVGWPTSASAYAFQMYGGARLQGPLTGPLAFFGRGGNVRGTGIMECGVRIEGTLTITDSPDLLNPTTLTVVGRFESSGTTVVRLPVAGTTPGSEYSQLHIVGSSSFAGAVELIPVEGFTFAPGQTFELARFASGDQVPSVTSPSRFRFMTELRPTSIVVSVFCPTDWTMDGVIDSADFFAFLGSFFGPGSVDFNRDGVTDSLDFYDFIDDFMGAC